MAVFADLNADGAPDLAIPGRGVVTVLMSDGVGGFAEPAMYDFGTGSGFASVTDVDSDGDSDLIIAESGASRAVILHNDGNGVFTDPVALDAGNEPVASLAADLDNDGDIDIAVLNLLSQDISLHLGNGDGTFADVVTFGGGTFPTSFAAADFDGDGLADLATASLGFGSGSEVRILHNLGNGIFTTTLSLSVGGQPQGMDVGDINGDGFPDIVTANQTTEDVSVLINNGDGTFAPVVGYLADTSLRAIELADFDLDGDLDIAAVNTDATGEVFIFDNMGDGTFDQPTTFSTSSRPRHVAAGDVDGDTDPDLIVTGQSEAVLLTNLAVIPGTTVPAPPDLLAVSDSGSSTSDNVTKLNNTPGSELSFSISGVSAGALVTLYADGISIGQAIAAGTSVTIVSNGTVTLADGAHQITATSEIGGDTSAPSEAITVTVDSVSPVFTSSAVTEALSGQAYSYNADTTEEGTDGFIYTLLTAPEGMDINVETGNVSWTPAADQLGTFGVTIRATDLAGNTADQTFGVTVTTDSGSTFEPSDREQFMLELLNRMRMNPADELDILLNSGDPFIDSALLAFEVDQDVLQQQWDTLAAAPPLAWNESLYNAALKHSELMRDLDEQSHQLPGEVPLGQRVQAEGYDFTVVGENVYAFGQNILHSHAAFAIDWGLGPDGIQDPPGHRINMMDSQFREIGIGIVDGLDGNSTGPLIITQDFGNRADLNNPYLLGVVYTDADGDGVYDEGEGVGGVSVRAEGTNGTFTATSLNAGGYQISLPAGEYTVTFSGEAFSTDSVRTITVGSDNTKLDVTTPPAAPDTPDLLPAYDTGANSSDNITSIDNNGINVMQFSVTGVTANADVILYSDGEEIGRETAQGAVVIITTNGDVPLTDGLHLITAQQVIGGQSGALSAELQLITDTTEPIFTSSAETAGNAASDYVYDVQTNEEGDDGLQYSLINAPADMSIDIDTGIIRWTPSVLDIGDHAVTVRAADLAGNSADQSYTLTIASAAQSGPDLIPVVSNLKLPEVFVPGDKAGLSVVIRNLGDTDTDALLDINFYLSEDNILDTDDFLAASITGKHLKIKSGKSRRVSTKYLVDDTIPVGNYFVIADIDTSNAVDELNENNNTAASADQFEHAWSFGTVAGRHNVKLTVHDSLGTLVKFSIKGEGRGDITGGSAFSIIDISGTNEKSDVRISPKGKTGTAVGDINVSGPLETLTGKTVDLLGDISIQGGISKLDLRDALAGSSVDIGTLSDPNGLTLLRFADVADLSATVGSVLRDVIVSRWIDTDGNADTLAAPAIKRLKVTGNRRTDIPGDAGFSMELSGTTILDLALGSARIAGSLLSGDWEIAGNTGVIKAGNVNSNWSATVTGNIHNVNINNDFNGSVTAGSVRNMRVGGDAGGSLTLTQTVSTDAMALDKLSVKGWLDGFTLRSAGNVDRISAGAARDSLLFAGVTDSVNDLPNPIVHFTTQAKISHVNIKSMADEEFSFINTNIAAYTLGNVAYSYAQTDNGGTPFGIAAHQLNHLLYKDGRGTFRWPNRDEPNGPADDGDRITRLA